MTTPKKSLDEEHVRQMARDDRDFSEVLDWVAQQVGYDREARDWARRIYNSEKLNPTRTKMQTVEQGGINWTWFKVRNGNLAAVFRLHYGEEQLEAFRTVEKGMTTVEDIKVPWAPWREECDVVADHTSRTEGYSTPEVIRAFGWLSELLRTVASPFELERCSENSMRHLEYHGVTICRIAG